MRNFPAGGDGFDRERANGRDEGNFTGLAHETKGLASIYQLCRWQANFKANRIRDFERP
jgi:hypothetical protein